MRNLAIAAILLFGGMVLAQEQKASQPEESGVTQPTVQPPDYGVSYKTHDGWQKLQQLGTSGLDAHVNMFTYQGGVKQVYQGTEAPVQLSDPRPVFYIKLTKVEQMMTQTTGSSPARSAMIVILSKKKDHRELQYMKGGVGLIHAGMKTGIDKKLTPDVTLHSINDGLFTITPNQDLSAGEYLITWSEFGGSYGTKGYDFSVKR